MTANLVSIYINCKNITLLINVHTVIILDMKERSHSLD